ncbi:MAG: lipopolysaccharide kinase InaA family protein [Longimicrobiales bacterium]
MSGPVITLPLGVGAATAGSALVVADRAILDDAIRAVRESGTLFDHARTHATRRLESGRGALFLTTLAGRDCVVRHARRGGALAPLLDDLHARIGAPRPVRELTVSHAVAALGVATPAVLAAAVYPGPAWFYRGDIVTAYVPGSADLAAVVFAGAGGSAGAGDGIPAEDAAAAAGRLLREVHRHRIDHPDLNLKNILVVRGGGVGGGEGGVRALLVDLDRARIRERLSPARATAMLRRFERSWRKWEGRTGRREPAALAAFRAGYEERPQAQANDPAPGPTRPVRR